MNYHNDIGRGAARIRELHERIHATFRSRSEEWRQTCRELHESYDSLAYPGGLEAGMSSLLEGDARAIEKAIAFLEVDPYFFRSGYIKEEIIRRLKGFALSDIQKRRLSRVIVRLVETRDGREFRRYCQLARRLEDPELEAALRERVASADRDVRRRARWVLEALASG